ncbi:MAG: hypothetical protein HC831_26010 [Chloroflexia bacterium]|nr:hypothetical protein [Chloroflexia bacterium]
MKKVLNVLSVLVIVMLVSSCGVNYALVDHQNQLSTQVQLKEANYKIVGRVSGSSEVSYVLFFGGLKKKQLYFDAYSKMLEAAKLEGTSRAIINVLVEEHAGGFPLFFVKRTLTVSAHVVEFNN